LLAVFVPEETARQQFLGRFEDRGVNALVEFQRRVNDAPFHQRLHRIGHAVADPVIGIHMRPQQHAPEIVRQFLVRLNGLLKILVAGKNFARDAGGVLAFAALFGRRNRRFLLGVQQVHFGIDQESQRVLNADERASVLHPIFQPLHAGASERL
jgi:hypothetical protein